MKCFSYTTYTTIIPSFWTLWNIYKPEKYISLLRILTIIILNFNSSSTSSSKAQWITFSSLETGKSLRNIISQHSNKGKALVNLIDLIIKEKPILYFKFFNSSWYCDCNGCSIKVSTYKGKETSST